MLRITHGTQNGFATIKLEGRLLGPWIDEVRQACNLALQPSTFLSMDLSSLTFVAATGTEFLRELISRGVKIGAYSSFTKELLQPETM